MAKSIEPQELKRQLANLETPTLIDVRRKNDYEASPRKIAGATWRDPEKIEEWINDLPSESPAVIYCVKGGAVSQGVASRLQQEGHGVLFLEGGLKAWNESGGPIE
jgi:rhodanese-related sulfurtransferase